MSRICWPNAALSCRTKLFGNGAGKFGPDYARRLKRRQGRLGDTWFLDEVFVAINGQRQYLWRAVDQDGDLIDLLVQALTPLYVKTRVQWLTEDQVVRKQAELSRTMWAVEYELQEPSAEGRAIDPAAVERMFDATLGTHIPAGDLAHTWRGQPGPPADRACPDPAGAWYCIGVDWAQKCHYTVAVRCDTTPLQVVAVYRIQRRPWPEMTERVGALLDEFPGPAVHDATGAGSAIGEFPALEAHRQLQGVTMVGRDRVDLFRNYIAAIERHEIVCPRIDVFYTEHLYCGEDDLFGSGHPPDTVVAMALAYHAFKTGRQPGDYGVTL